MVVLGITGAIATGKTTVLSWFSQRGIPSLSADAIVHRLYQTDTEIIQHIRQAFPGTHVNGICDRFRLAQMISRSSDLTALLKNLETLERIVHPAVHREMKSFVNTMRDADHPMVVLEIPLLFEAKESYDFIDITLATYAPHPVQNERIRARMAQNTTDTALLSHMIARQLSSKEKIRRADIAVSTHLPQDLLDKCLEEIFEAASHKFLKEKTANSDSHPNNPLLSWLKPDSQEGDACIFLNHFIKS